MCTWPTRVESTKRASLLEHMCSERLVATEQSWQHYLHFSQFAFPCPLQGLNNLGILGRVSRAVVVMLRGAKGITQNSRLPLAAKQATKIR